jgi:hypothetical protein
MNHQSLVPTAEHGPDVLTDTPDHVLEAARAGRVPEGVEKLTMVVRIRDWPDGKEHRVAVRLSASLLELMRAGAQALGVPLLPPAPQPPLDFLRAVERRTREWSNPLENLEMPLWLALASGFSPEFGIQYRLVIRINALWGVAPESSVTPRSLLAAFGFDPAQFTLYQLNSTTPLPPDAPVMVTRGECLEAQRDGRYGSSAVAPARGYQSIEDDIANLSSSGVNVRLLIASGQKYADVRDVTIPSPPWSGNLANILVAIPATYPTGGLDAFYLEQTVSCGGSVPNQQSVVAIDCRQWGLISWHYANDRPWRPTRDDLASHLVHCRGYFLRRGVRG